MEVVKGNVNISLKDFREMEEFITEVKAGKHIAIRDNYYHEGSHVKYYCDKEIAELFKSDLESAEAKGERDVSDANKDRDEYKMKFYGLKKELKEFKESQGKYHIFDMMGFWEAVKWIRNYRK